MGPMKNFRRRFRRHATAPVPEAPVHELSISKECEKDGVVDDVDQVLDGCARNDVADTVDDKEQYYFCQPDRSDVAWRNYNDRLNGALDPVATNAQAYSGACTRAEVIHAIGGDRATTLELVAPVWSSLTSSVTTANTTLPSYQEDVSALVKALIRNRLEFVKMDHGFFCGLGQQDREDLVWAIARLPCLRGWSLVSNADNYSRTVLPSDTDDFELLCAGLQHTQGSFQHIELSGILLQNGYHVQQLANGIKAHDRSLRSLILKDILVNTEHVQPNMLDPILQAFLDPPRDGIYRFNVEEFVLRCPNRAVSTWKLLSL